MSTFKKIISSAAVAAAVSIFSGTVGAETLKMGHIVPPSHVWHKVSERFADNLATATHNESTVRIFPLSKLGKEPQLTDMLQSGAIQFSVLTVGGLSNRNESLNGWFMPYIFKDVAHAARTTQGDTAQQMLKDLEQHGLIGLGYTLAGMRHVLSVEQINAIADLQNQKVRSFPNKVFNDWWNTLGAAPTAMPISEVAPALTTNLLDAVDVDLDIVVGLKFYQQAPHLTMTNHMAFPAVFVVSKVWWDAQTPEKQQAVLGAFKEAESWGFQQQIAAETANLEKLKAAGVSVATVDEEKFSTIADEITARYSNGDSQIQRFVADVKSSAN